MAAKPSGYDKDLPRVSSIVEWAYPFEWENRKRFEDWLWKNDVELGDYMKEASEGGTSVHKALETFMEWGVPKYKKRYSKIVEGGIQFIRDYEVKPIEWESYVLCRDYQGTCDLICEIGWEKWIVDWKTYWLAKIKFNLRSKEYRKPHDKLKKAKLQLNLYGKVKKIKKFAVVELTEDWYKFHPLELIPAKELNKIIKDFKYSYVDEI